MCFFSKRTKLPTTIQDETVVAPEHILQARTVSWNGHLVLQWLIKWSNLALEDATLEDQAQFPEFQKNALKEVYC